LTAQQDTARWTMLMLAVGMLTTMIGVVGLWFIRETLHATRATVDETRRIGEAQVRAYLSIKSATISVDKSGLPWVQMVVVNTGQSPARKFCWTHHVRIHASDSDLSWSAVPVALGEYGNLIDIPIGETDPLTLGILGTRLSAKELGIFRKSSTVFFKVKMGKTSKKPTTSKRC
jgi:hypothetical protein